MNKQQKNAFVIVPDGETQARWLRDVLEDEGEVVTADATSIDRVRQLLDLTGSQVVFVGLSSQNLRQTTAFIEDLVTFKTMLLVIAVADHADHELLLSAMRAGAREFITSDSKSSEVLRQLHRLQNRAPVTPHNTDKRGRITTLVSARPGTDSPMLALHLALAAQMQTDNEKTLLLDLGTPAADTLTYLGINAPYDFTDAVRSLRRLDAVLIDTAFAKHDSGLKLLALPEDHHGIGEVTSADVYVLLGVLQRYFSNIIINLGGVPYSDFLNLIVNNSDTTLVVLEQSVPSCKQNMQLIRKLTQGPTETNTIKLVVDHYLPSLPPDADNLARGLNLELLMTLPSSGMARLKMMNSGESLFKCAPRDPYTLAVRKMAKKLYAREATDKSESRSGDLLGRVKSWMRIA